MSRTVLHRECNQRGSFEDVWDHLARVKVRVFVEFSACTPYSYPVGALVDAWCDNTTRVEVYHKGNGRLSFTNIANASQCERPVCGLKIDRVDVTNEGSDLGATATVFISGHAGEIEYSLNGFTDLQASNVFNGLGIGAYTAYARVKADRGCVYSFPFQVRGAYKERYFIDWKDAEEDQWHVSFETRGYTGTSQELRGADVPYSGEWIATGSKLASIRGSRAQVNFLLESDGVTTDFYTLNDREMRCSIYKNNVLYWRGFVVPELLDEPWLTYPVEVTVQCSDGLGGLKTTPYLEDNGLRYYGRETALEILRRCLLKLDLETDVYTAVNIWDDKMDLTKDPLAQAFLDQNNYYDDGKGTADDCESVLTKVLTSFSAFVVQWGGCLHVVRYPEQVAPYVRRRYVDWVYTDQQTYYDLHQIRRDGAISYREKAQRRTVRPAVGKVIVKLDYGAIVNFVPNGDFEDWGTAYPYQWTGTANVGKAILSTGRSFVMQYLDLAANIGVAKYMESTASTIAGVSGFNNLLVLSVDYTVTYTPSESTPKLYLELRKKGQYGNQKVSASGFSYNFFQDAEARLQIPLPVRNETFPVTESGTYEIIFDVADISGAVQVRLYEAVYGGGTTLPDPVPVVRYTVDNVKIEARPTGSIENMELSGVNDFYSTLNPLEVSVGHGSNLTPVEALVTLADKTPSVFWEKGMLLQEIALRETLAQHRKGTLVLSASLTGNVSPLTVLKDPHMTSHRFTVDGLRVRAREHLSDVEAQAIFGHADETNKGVMLMEDGTPMLTESKNYMIREKF